MKGKLKNEKGITLIALIITIIILLILAVVSINIAMNEGIITKSKEATEKHTESQEIEQISIAYSNYKIEKVKNENYTMQNALEERTSKCNSRR